LVRHYLAEGCRVVATARAPREAHALQRLELEYDQHFMAVPLDVDSDCSISALSDLLAETRLDLVFNNAGISAAQDFGQWTSRVMVDSFRTNVIGPALLAQALSPLLNRGAALVNLSSGLASLEFNLEATSGLDAYAMSKAALNMLTRHLAELLKPREMVVIALSPGWVRTGMGGENAPASVEEAVGQISTFVSKLDPRDSGGFYSPNGENLPW
jgi:NAD(P)-dependent dehydrogenase (short-subunit alcohol dehydrogenase family)